MRFVGEAVALVIASSRDKAANAAELVAVEYDTMPAVTDPESALDALDDAEAVVSGRFVNQRLAPVPLKTPSPHNPLGFKGVGEASTIGSVPAVQNAVVDALSRLGVRNLDMPLTQERVWRAIHEAGA